MSEPAASFPHDDPNSIRYLETSLRELGSLLPDIVASAENAPAEWQGILTVGDFHYRRSGVAHELRVWAPGEQETPFLLSVGSFRCMQEGEPGLGLWTMPEWKARNPFAYAVYTLLYDIGRALAQTPSPGRVRETGRGEATPLISLEFDSNGRRHVLVEEQVTEVRKDVRSGKWSLKKFLGKKGHRHVGRRGAGPGAHALIGAMKHFGNESLEASSPLIVKAETGCLAIEPDDFAATIDSSDRDTIDFYPEDWAARAGHLLDFTPWEDHMLGAELDASATVTIYTQKVWATITSYIPEKHLVQRHEFDIEPLANERDLFEGDHSAP